MLRLFIAVDMPAAQKQEVARLCADVPGMRWVKPHQLHVTLRFMGDTPAEALPAIRACLGGVHMPPFELALHGVGVFPAGARRPRVLWLGVVPPAPLLRLAQEIDRVLVAGGLAQGRGVAEPREFSPHLTLARLSGKRDPGLTHFLTRHADYRAPSYLVDCFHLYQSTLQATGAVHQVLATYHLNDICRET